MVYQSSFPHESTGHWLRRWLYQTLLRMGGRRVNAVLAVSPLGLSRASRFFGHASERTVIPLLADLPPSRQGEPDMTSSQKLLRFVYVGTHRARRQLDVVLEGVVRALDDGASAEFMFVGGLTTEIGELRKVGGVDRWERIGRIKFIKEIPRPQIPSVLTVADVGLSLVPATEINREMSPTKLAEYMGAGLAVLASDGVDLQKEIVRKSGAGVLVEFEAKEIGDAITSLVQCPDRIVEFKQHALEYSEKHLRYENYVPAFKQALEVE
ncbi:glycosyltransferase [Ectothiorhodospira haloalkaliphila]|uniref:glycosyltransferase n=1 Tax=Ectothiorhodospira haloalkaliphila TaxID=421628 RepID=UPI001EE8B699|nr:glycosyltransferase [Ectothiorhodospira haloalkaliphila]MCG5525276.1 glycosyltransferase [Ectothiorhodospira haloalkaliphila]